MSAILQTLIGAAAAIVGGFVGAWWQTRRADDIARRSRREERRERALLDLWTKAGDIAERLARIRRAAASQPLTGQYEAARQAVDELTSFYAWDVQAVIPDQAVRDAWLTFDSRSDELLPLGADATVRYTEDDPAAKAEHFQNDLMELTQTALRLRQTARRAMDDPFDGNPPH
jgi:hypothetical protein